ncbi:MAG TPA: histidine--tRNA ligase [Methanospirillum sp.]|uniref:histidine--tRNA ligase n=2 Tax=Methanospirillum sp. TaxID=45200 RepID=UPI002D0DE66E|nr:histidine--tRNA ligase [Methanospirillum sp.]HOJ95916.1 histidine--tRNA ligase [Methanospirillum sp.]HOL41119.1 histidine--tRNA ligase [Methanospirillum sp.]
MIQKPRGTRDMLPDEMERRREIEARMRARARLYGFREIATPVFEELELFTIRSGEGIINEMYVFEDKGGRTLALRPELTAPVLRMYVEEGRSLTKPVKWCYFADCFRYERPQKGRYRQFWQFGTELIGADSAMGDAEVIILGYDLLKTAGVTFVLRIGHLSFMRTLLADLSDSDAKKIRAFLDKREEAAAVTYLHDIGQDHLCDPLIRLCGARTLDDVFAVIGEIPEAARIQETFAILDAAGIPYEINPAIARGLDYYTGIVFECFAEGLGAENQILGGGAYRLAHLFGGEDTPSVGFAIGFDRVMVALGETGWNPWQPQVMIIATSEARTDALRVARELRMHGIITETDVMDRSFSAQMKAAGRSADYAVIIGKEEVATGTVTLKDLKAGTQEKVTVPEAIQKLTCA